MEDIYKLPQSTKNQQSTTGAKSLRQQTNDKLLRTLAAAVAGEAATATFACGGAASLMACDSSEAVTNGTIFGIDLRWDSKSESGGSKLSFPLRQTSEDEQKLEKLITDCQPATFGVGGKDVLDESYRKASKLDCTSFSTNFHPHDYGIVDSIRQVLFPSMVTGGEGIGIGTRGIKAELYKLNIYSSPSGFFQAHVDTPRGPKQFGSLVVCLQCTHKGGALLVEHGGQAVEFDWSSSPEDVVQWAAFYGDCKHQVLEVTSGHRIALTYNLYFTDIGNLACPTAKPENLPLYSMVKDMLAQPGFMVKGGVLGFFCTHQYAHSHSSGRKSLPGSLKGVDLATFSVFAALGLHVEVRPIIPKPDGDRGGLTMRLPNEESSRKSPRSYLRASWRFDGTWSETLNSDEDEDQNNDKDSSKSVSCGYEDPFDVQGSFVGKNLHGPVIINQEEEETISLLETAWPFDIVPQILWMNKPVHEDFAFARLAYSNQASLDWEFSAAAIIVNIPGRSIRNLSFNKGSKRSLSNMGRG